MRRDNDAYGQLILAHLEGKPSYEVIERDDGFVALSGGAPSYFAGYKNWPAWQKRAIKFEARKPKGLAKIAEVSGKVSVEDSDKAITVVITDAEGEEHRHTFPRRTRLFVESSQKIEAGTQLNEGSLYPAELLEVRGRTETELYLVREVQEVYKSQGVDIDDKHIELIVRQMMKKVRVDQRGDTGLLPGQFIDRQEFGRDEPEPPSTQGGEPAQAEEIILGITKASLNTDSFLWRRRSRRPPRS